MNNGSDNGTVGKISGNFIGNSVKGELAYLRGGAIAIRHGDTSPVIDADFINNYAVNTRVLSGADAQARPVATGGAIDTSADTTFVADNVNHVFSGNYTLDKFGKEYNALFVNSSFKPTISFNTAHNGQWIINDSIKGDLTELAVSNMIISTICHLAETAAERYGLITTSSMPAVLRLRTQPSVLALIGMMTKQPPTGTATAGLSTVLTGVIR